jgi:transposase
MERNKRLYPIDEEQFNRVVVPIIEASHIGKGRPPKVSHYRAFCGILYILRTGVPWRDLPGEYGEWHTIYDRFNRGNARGLWNKVLVRLQGEAGLLPEEVIIDSTTMKVHRHGGGQKGGSRAKGCPALE